MTAYGARVAVHITVWTRKLRARKMVLDAA